MSNTTIFCFVPGNTSPFSVKIGKMKTVDELKEKIWTKIKSELDDFPLYKLTLHRVEIKAELNRKKFIEELERLSQTLNKRGGLDERREVAKYFGLSPPEGLEYYVIVQLPAGASRSASVLHINPVLNRCAIATDKATVIAQIAEFTASLRPRIEHFLTNPRFDTWNPPGSLDEETKRFYQDLNIPRFKHRPSLLLHRLGVDPNPSVGQLFQGPGHRILCNTPGSGKTRLLFDGLCRHWGFYFVLAQDTDRVGAPDFQEAIEGMWRTPGWMCDIFENPELVGAANGRNQAIASYRVSKVLLARWVIFNTFIEVVKDFYGGHLDHAGTVNDTRHAWLLFQILPLGTYRDPFSQFTRQCLEHVDYGVLESLRESWDPVRVLGPAFNPSTDVFSYVLDKAQVAGSRYLGAFSDANGAVERPVLPPIIRHLTYPPDHLIKVIVSGTGFSFDLFKTVLASGVSKVESEWRVVHETGDFSDQGVQWGYISRYLPPKFLLSPSGRHLQTRIHKWLRGRYGFTVSYLEQLMMGHWEQDRPRSPHKVFNAFVRRYVDFTPLDGNRFILEGEPNVKRVYISGLPWYKISQVPKLMEELSYTIFSFFTQGDVPLWWVEQEFLVEYGFARFLEGPLTGGKKRQAAVDEPLVLISITGYFETHSYTLTGNVRRKLQNNKGAAFGEAVLLAMTRLLQKQNRLRDIFEFHDETSPWADRTAQIVARNSFGDFEDFSIAVPIIPSFAFSAKNVEDVASWLESGVAGWCIAGIQTGPHLMARLQLDDGRFLLLVVQAKRYSQGSTDTVSANAIESVTPEISFESLTKLEARKPIDSILEALNKGAPFTEGKYDLLGAVSAFPLENNFDLLGGLVRRALRNTTHPLARLTTRSLTSALISCQNGKSIVGPISTEPQEGSHRA